MVVSVGVVWLGGAGSWCAWEVGVGLRLELGWIKYQQYKIKYINKKKRTDTHVINV